MSREERLFDAIGGVDDSLLKRSEKRKRQTPWLNWGIGLAACLAVVLTVTWVLPGIHRETPPPDTIVDDYPPDSPSTPVQEDPPSSTPAQPSEPWPAAEGEAHYLQVRVAPEEPELRFRIYINKDIYYSYEREGVYIIRPREAPEVPGETLPECKLEISHIADVTVDEALEQTMNSLTGLYETVEAALAPLNSWFYVTAEERYLFASDGIKWNDAQLEVWIKPDGAGGAFILSSRYFMEATEGHGARFADMMYCFAPDITGNPDDWQPWERDLMDTGEQLAKAVFANDLDRAEDLLAPDAEVYGYDEDVSGWVSIASIDYSVSNGTADTVIVSVKHRMGGEDSYTFLTMEMTYLDGQWKAYWIGLEK